MNRYTIALAAVVVALSSLSLPRAASAAHPSHHGAGLLTFVASVVGVTPTVLQQDLKAGQTLLQIAGNKYATADDLADALLAPVKAKLDKAASTNALSATQANAIYTQLHARIAALVVTPHPRLGLLRAGGHRSGIAPHLRVRSGLLSTLVTTCNTTGAALKTAIHTGGKSLLAICQATNPSVTQSSLVTALLNVLKSKLDKAVEAKMLTATQETAYLTRAQTYLNTLVTTPIPAGGLRGH